MPTPNIKVYIAVSGVLIVLFLIVTFIPFGKKSVNNQSTNFPTPTLVQINQSNQNQNIPTPTIAPADFTGVAPVTIPPAIMNLSRQKQDLRGKVPLQLATFSVDFDYGEDKFVVTLKDPKDQAKQDFENWRSTNYPDLGSSEFNFR
ncbi:hypothetical protein M1328_01950 [Patescibacteria group bacterium]|nr:hypothetical protein [Patescibacteria group bacterium]